MCRLLSMHTCSMPTTWPSFASKRAPRQQPKTRAFSQYVYRAGSCRAHRCGRALPCAPLLVPRVHLRWGLQLVNTISSGSRLTVEQIGANSNLSTFVVREGVKS